MNLLQKWQVLKHQQGAFFTQQSYSTVRSPGLLFVNYHMKHWMSVPLTSRSYFVSTLDFIYQIHTSHNAMVRKILASLRKTSLGLTKRFRPNGTPLLHNYNTSANLQQENGQLYPETQSKGIL